MKTARTHAATDLTDLLDGLDDGANGDPVEVGDLLKAARARGFGPLLLVPAILLILPTGAVPGVPAICGLLTAFISFQIVIGRQHPWLPQKIRMFSLPRKKLKAALRKSRTVTRKIDSWLDRRMEILTGRTGHRIAGFMIFLLSPLIIFIGFVPFFPAMIAVPIFFFGLGFTAHDGFLIAIGFFLVLLIALSVPWLLPAD